jgi:hypothetical protein
MPQGTEENFLFCDSSVQPVAGKAGGPMMYSAGVVRNVTILCVLLAIYFTQL